MLSTSSDYCNLPKTQDIEGVKIKFVGQGHFRTKGIKGDEKEFKYVVKEKVKPLEYLFESVKTIRRTLMELKKFSPDVTHIFLPFPVSSILCLILRIRGKKVYLDVDDLITGQAEQSGHKTLAIIRFFEKMGVMFANRISVCSEYLKQKYGKKATIIPNMVYIDEYNQKQKGNKNITVAYIGNFGYYQSCDGLINEIPRILKNTDSTVHFTFIGGGNTLNNFIEKTKDMNNVIVKGWLNKKDIIISLSTSSIGLLPMDDVSVNKARHPLKLLEYQASRMAVIAPKVGMLKEYTNGENIIFYNAGDFSSMADKIIELCNNKKLREKITENGYKFVKKYNVNTIMKKWIRFYEV